MKHLAALLFSSVVLVAPTFLYAEDEYTFDLKNPPEYAKEAFAIVAQSEKAHTEGPASGLLKAGQSRFYKQLEPKPGSPAVQWAAYRWGSLCLGLSNQPNFAYLEKVRTGSKDTKELFLAMKAWSHDGFCRANTIGIWGLGMPDVDPKTPVAEVKKLHRYITRLAARMLRRVKDTYDPDFRKTFYIRPEDTPYDLRLERCLEKPPTEAELAQNMRDLCNYRWRQEMFRIHNSLGSVLRFLKSDLCVIFRTHMPGDKATIKEMLAEAGFKTAEERKAFWEHCRTVGATWSMWTEADEARLVTD